MSDNDLIRRGDALKVAEAEMRRYGFGLPGGRGDQMQAAINDIPAVSPDVAALVEALRSTLNFIENTEGEMGVILGCGDKARAALASVKGETK